MKLRLDDGTELFYTVDDFTDPWTEPETVLMHHGMAKNHRMWFGWVPTIARHYRVIRFDMRGMGQSDVPEEGYYWSLDNFTNDLEEVADKLGLERFHLIGETVGGSISMNYSTRREERLRSLTVCTSPTSFDSHHQESADLIEREGIEAWVDDSIGRRLDPDLVPPEYIRWYADQMKATPARVVHGFQSNAGGDLGPALRMCRRRCWCWRRPACARRCWATSAGRRPVPQRQAGGVPRHHRIRAAHPANGLRPGLAGLGAIPLTCIGAGARDFLGPPGTQGPSRPNGRDTAVGDAASTSAAAPGLQPYLPAPAVGARPRDRQQVGLARPRFARHPWAFAFQAVLATVVMLAILAFVNSLSSAAIAAGLASSVVGIFIGPSNRTASVRSVVGGHALALLLGTLFSVILFLGPVEGFLTDRTLMHNVSLALAVGLAMLFMAFTNTEHPPGRRHRPGHGQPGVRRTHLPQHHRGRGAAGGDEAGNPPVLAGFDVIEANICKMQKHCEVWR